MIYRISKKRSIDAFVTEEIPVRLAWSWKKLEDLSPSVINRKSVIDYKKFCEVQCKQINEQRDLFNFFSNFEDVLENKIENIVYDLGVLVKEQNPTYDDLTSAQALMNNVYKLKTSTKLLITHERALVDKSYIDEDFKGQGNISQNFSIIPVLQDAIHDLGAFSTEKYGLSPNIKLFHKQQNSTMIIGCPSFVYFVVMEVLKNSTTAMVNKYGLMELNLCPGIEIRVSENDYQVHVRILDQAGGIQREFRPRVFDYFFTTLKTEEPTYTYSGNFGVPMSGYGCGLPLSKLFLNELFAGDIQLIHNEGGTEAVLIFDKSGKAEI